MSLHSPHLKSDGEGGDLCAPIHDADKILERIEELDEESMKDIPGLMGTFWPSCYIFYIDGWSGWCSLHGWENEYGC